MSGREPASKDSIILESQNLTVRFGGLEALRSVTFSIAQHQISSVIGPNGAGKTTLLNVISGIIPPEEGQILFRGSPITRLRPHAIAARGICRTFQQAQLFGNLTALENVMVGMHPRTKAGFLGGALHLPRERSEERGMRAKAQNLLDFFGLSHRRDWKAGHLSIAEQRRLEIARALAPDPALLLLDEPVAGLNIRETEEMGILILKLQEGGQSVLLVEHNMHLVMAISHRLIVLHHGAKIAEGCPEAIQKDRRVIEAYLGG